MHHQHSIRHFPKEMAALWQLAWPILVGQVALIGMGVADVAMSGHDSANALAAVSLGTSIWSIIIVTLMGLMMAINPSVAHHVGAGTLDQIPSLVRQSLWKAVFAGLIGVVCTNAATLAFAGMRIEADVRADAVHFVNIISTGLPAFTAYRVLYGYSAGLGHTRPMMVMSILALIWNVLVNYALIYGHFGLPAMGGLGCAVATSSSVWLMLIAMVVHVMRSPVYRETQPLTHFEGPHFHVIKGLTKIGLPIGITYFAEASAFSLVALLVADFGAREVAAHQIALNFSSLVFMVPMSLGIGLITRVGVSMGEGDPHEARYRAWAGVSLGLIWAVISASLIALFALPIASFYTADSQVAERAATLLILAAIFQLSDATQVTTSSAIRGYKVTRPPMIIHMTAFWAVCLPLGYVLGRSPAWAPWAPAKPMAAEGFWIALVAGLTVAAIGLCFLLRHTCNRFVAKAEQAHTV
ncbi:MATE family efflux transporter [Burkholderiaceae bacterium DAT-1]|nr:MATE family efflux transporter [Burkholderiaceae bacterium DAT-1]